MKNIHPLNWIQWLTLALVLCVGVTVPLIFLRIESVQHHQNDALRSVICLAESFVRNSKHLSPQQKNQSLDFYNRALSDARLRSCDH